MTTPDISAYTSAANAQRQQFANLSAQNTFNKNVAQTQNARTAADFQQGFNRQLPSFTAGFSQRGMSGGGINSGVMRGAMQDYLGDYTRDYGRMQQDFANQNNQFDFNQSGYQAQLNANLADIHAQKQSMIAQTAQHIQGLSPYLTWS